MTKPGYSFEFLSVGKAKRNFRIRIIQEAQNGFQAFQNGFERQASKPYKVITSNHILLQRCCVILFHGGKRFCDQAKAISFDLERTALHKNRISWWNDEIKCCVF